MATKVRIDAASSSSASSSQHPQVSSLSQAFITLIDQVVLGPEIPNNFSTPPWRIPPSAHVKYEAINKILSHSMSVQSATVPGNEYFNDYIVTNSSLPIIGLLRSYFHAVLGKEVTDQVEVTLGVSESHGNKSPYLWLQVLGHTIDNNYWYIPNDDKNVLFYEDREGLIYIKEVPELGLHLGQDREIREAYKLYDRVHQAYGNNDAIEKYVVLTAIEAELDPGVTMYDILMREFLRAEFGVEAENLRTKWGRRCWNCATEATTECKLKSCAGCKNAKYCSKECQAEDWKDHKLLHQKLNFSKNMLAKKAANKGRK